jgi:hypothetical protein
MIVGGRIFYQDNAYNLQKVFKGAVSAYGIPSKLYVDYTEESTMPKISTNIEFLSFYLKSFGIVFLHFITYRFWT